MMISDLFKKRLELNDRKWFENVSKNNSYTLCSIKIGDSDIKLLKKLGNSNEIKEDKSKNYKVYYYHTEEYHKIGFQIINSRISGFTLINDNGVTKKEIINKLGEAQSKNIVLGQIFNILDYEIEANIYNYDEYNLRIKLDKMENIISAFYFGRYWTRISLECYPTEIH